MVDSIACATSPCFENARECVPKEGIGDAFVGEKEWCEDGNDGVEDDYLVEGTGLGRWMGYDELVVVIGGDHVALLCACGTGM
eukprot:scaffold1831_cov198-Alexandrium_tamarense.AAC.4